MSTQRVIIPQFDPAVDCLIIEVGDQEFEFVADFELLYALSEGKLELGGESDKADMDSVIKLLHAGCAKRHPGLTENDVRGWFPTVRALAPVGAAIEKYFEGLGLEQPGKGEDGQGEASVGANSGRGRATTSASRRRR